MRADPVKRESRRGGVFLGIFFPMKVSARQLLLPSAAIAAVLLAFGFGFVSGRFVRQAAPARPLADPPALAQEPDWDMVKQAWSIIDRRYVDRAALTEKTLTYGAIRGMVDSLGDTGHSTFLSPDLVEQQMSFVRGSYAGVGLQIEMKDGHVTVVTPMDGSPASKAGLRAGDQIVRVDGVDVDGLSISQVVRRIVGQAGTRVTLTIVSPAVGKPRELTLTRALIRIENVSWQPIPGEPVADLRIAAFSAGVTDEVKAYLEAIEKAGYSSVVLDLRNDPGGELSEAIGVASQFLVGGNVLLEKAADGDTRSDPAKPGGAAPSRPVVVLVNNGTASAAEIVAGALQDAGRAKVVGETTFGTGTVLQSFKLGDGSMLLLAVTEWLTPSGRSIWHKGIAPDVPTPLPADAEPVTPETLKGAAREVPASDVQLAKAIEILTKK